MPKRLGKHMRKIIIAIIALLDVIVILKVVLPEQAAQRATQKLPPIVRTTPIPSPTQQSVPSAILKPTPHSVATSSAILAAKTLNVPFLVQAPHANWDALHEDACEEASLLNVVYFLQGKVPANLDDGENEIQNLISFETKNGYGLSITLQQLADIAKQYYGLNGHVVQNATIATIKQEIAKSHPVIVGAAGKILPNPYFKNGGPNYHMLVIKGYDDKAVIDPKKCRSIDTVSCSMVPGIFITNDVGIRQGNSFQYTYQGLFASIHDWDSRNILNGQKDYLVFD